MGWQGLHFRKMVGVCWSSMERHLTQHQRNKTKVNYYSQPPEYITSTSFQPIYISTVMSPHDAAENFDDVHGGIWSHASHVPRAGSAAT
jgi:hypothetical protein